MNRTSPPEVEMEPPAERAPGERPERRFTGIAVSPGVAIGAVFGAVEPPAIVNRLHAEVVKMVKDTDMKERLLGLGADPVGNTPEQFRTLIQNEINKWTRVIRTVGIKEEV